MARRGAPLPRLGERIGGKKRDKKLFEKADELL